MSKPITFGIRQNRRVARSGKLRKLSLEDRIKLLEAIESNEALPSIEFEDGRKIRLRREEPQPEPAAR